MAFSLIVEDGTGKPDANSYASVAEADAYHEAQLHALAWEAATVPVKEKALAMATRTLDAMVQWTGTRATATQALAWPRKGTVLDGLPIPENVVPNPVKQAASELARLLIAGDITQDVAQNDLSGLNLGKGALQLSFKSDAVKRRVPSIIGDLLQGLGEFTDSTQGGIKMRRVGR